MYPFCFKVKINSYTNKKEKAITETGIGIASTMTEAMSILEDRYGEDLIAVEHLEKFEYNNIILFPEEICRKYLNLNFSEASFG